MFKPDQIANIKRLLGEGVPPEKIASEEYGIATSSFRSRLSNSGYRIVLRRELEQIIVVAPTADSEPLSTTAA